MATEIEFEGWFQCRLATDPDDYDEPRGDSGWTFALGTEPDLDRIIRFHDPVAHRSHAPPIGVWTREIRVDGQPIPAHPLQGMRLILADSPVYEGRNGEVATSAREPIAPWHLRIDGDGIDIDGLDPIDLNSEDEVRRRQPFTFIPNSSEVLNTTGIGDPAGYRQQRAQAVQTELAAETDIVQQQALQFRLSELAKGSIQRNSLAFQLKYDFELRGPNRIVDPEGVLGLGSGTGLWRVRFWMGGWDADDLCGYVKGTLLIA